MSNVIPFSFDSFQVRVVTDDHGEPWFVAKDVAEALGYKNPAEAVRAHCKRVKILKNSGSLVLDIPARGLQIIPEPDMYRLIARSNLPSAERFERWVFEEVLPSIRKTGTYGRDPLQVLSDPHELRNLLGQYSEKVIALEHTVQEQAPKVAFYDAFANADGLYGLQNAARALGLGPNKFPRQLRDEGYLFYQGGALVPYQRYREKGIFDVQCVMVDDKARYRTFVTPKGIQYFARKFGVDGLAVNGVLLASKERPATRAAL